MSIRAGGAGTPVVFDTSAWQRQRAQGARERSVACRRPTILIAAAAAERSFGVLHYDRHFDLLCDVLGIERAWIAPRGSLD